MFRISSAGSENNADYEATSGVFEAMINVDFRQFFTFNSEPI